MDLEVTVVTVETLLYYRQCTVRIGCYSQRDEKKRLHLTTNDF